MNIIRHAQEENNARIDRTVFPLYFSAENVLQAIAPPRASLDLYGDLSRIYGDLCMGICRYGSGLLLSRR